MPINTVLHRSDAGKFGLKIRTEVPGGGDGGAGAGPAELGRHFISEVKNK